MLIFLYLPIIILVVFSFNSSEMNIVFENFTFDWYKNLMQNNNLINAFINTLIVAISSTVISTIIGTISAVGLHKYKLPLKNLINKLIYIPIFAFYIISIYLFSVN